MLLIGKNKNMLLIGKGYLKYNNFQTHIFIF